MTAIRLHTIPFAADPLRSVADLVLGRLPGAAGGDLSAGLVLLPSSRACRALQHVLLEASGRDALLLPRLLTVQGWAAEAAACHGLDAVPVPDDRVRPLVLAPALAATAWLADDPGAAPGLAREVLAFADEARLHGRADLLLDPDGRAEVLSRVSAAEAEVVGRDLDRIHEGWQLYRDAVPRDGVDLLVDLARILAEGAAPGPVRPEFAVAAAFGRVDPVRGDLLRSALSHAAEGVLAVPAAEGSLVRQFVATWDPAARQTGPLAPTRHAVARVCGEDAAAGTEQDAPTGTLRERLAAVRADAGEIPSAAVELRPCSDPESESRVVADEVAGHLAAGADRRVVVATPDPRLAARVRAQLTAAGIDADHTHGDPLSSLPAGLLLRFVLRAALTDLRSGPLLEVLTHPYVGLPVAEGSHGVWTTRLERMFRNDRGPRGGLAALHRRATERDAAVLNLIRRDRPADGDAMVAFVTLIADAFAPLLPAGDGRAHPWADLLAALRTCWESLAPDYPLGEFGESRADVQRLAALLADLARDADRLPPVTLAAFSAELGRLLAAENAAPHRRPHLPVVVTGLVEARLERCDVLVLAGLRDGVFPARAQRPLFLGGALRERLGLPGWTDAPARDAELFLRLLHAAPRVLVTWAVEEEGTPALPSSFVSRLELLLPEVPAPDDAAVPSWRRTPAPLEAIAATEARERVELAGPLVPAVPIRPFARLSWTALRTWRDCPFRFVLERGFALRRDDEVLEEFGALDHGNLVHRALEDWLRPEADGWRALASGDQAAATVALEEAARTHFDQGLSELPQRRLWWEAFRDLIPGLVALEAGRFGTWRPVAVEQEFAVPLADLRAWSLATAAEAGEPLDLPDLPEHAATVTLTGTIDRIDRGLAGEGLTVIDYKTGSRPGAKQVEKGEDLQVVLYAAAVALGGVGEAVPATSLTGLYYGVKNGELGPPPTPHVPAGVEGAGLLARGAAQLVELACGASDPQGPFPVLRRELQGDGPANLPCRHCDYRGVCRIEERDLPPATARKLDKLVNRKDPA